MFELFQVFYTSGTRPAGQTIHTLVNTSQGPVCKRLTQLCGLNINQTRCWRQSLFWAPIPRSRLYFQLKDSDHSLSKVKNSFKKDLNFGGDTSCQARSLTPPPRLMVSFSYFFKKKIVSSPTGRGCHCRPNACHLRCLRRQRWQVQGAIGVVVENPINISYFKNTMWLTLFTSKLKLHCLCFVFLLVKIQNLEK